MISMKMDSRHSSMVLALLLFVAAVLACKGSVGYQTTEANNLVNEGNAAIEEGKKYVTEAQDKQNQMLHTKVSQLAEARTLAKESIAAYDKAEDKCKEAAKKYDEASKLNVQDKFKEYLGLKVKEYNKRAEVVEAARSTPQALLDSESRNSFITRANAATEKVDALNKEAEDFAAQADKIQKDNPDIFKSS